MTPVNRQKLNLIVELNFNPTNQEVNDGFLLFGAKTIGCIIGSEGMDRRIDSIRNLVEATPKRFNLNRKIPRQKSQNPTAPIRSKPAHGDKKKYVEEAAKNWKSQQKRNRQE